jgi:WD40 repeat protein
VRAGKSSTVWALVALASCAGAPAPRKGLPAPIADTGAPTTIHGTGPFWSTDDIPPQLAPTGLRAELLANHPAPRAPTPDELHDVTASPPIRLERVLGQYGMHHSAVWQVAFLPDGRRLLSHGRNGDIKIWDPITHTRLKDFTHCPGYSNALQAGLVLSPDGRLAATIVGGNICVRDLDDGHVVKQWAAHEAGIDTVAFAPGGEIVTYAYQDEYIAQYSWGSEVAQEEKGGEMRRWRLDAAAKVSEAKLGPSITAGASPDGSLIALLRPDQVLRAFDGSGQPLWTAKRKGWGRFTFLPDGHRLLVTETKRLHLVDARTGDDLGDLTPTSPVEKLQQRPDEGPASWNGECTVVSPDGRRALTSLYDDRATWVWDLETRRQLEHTFNHDIPLCLGALSGDGTLVATPDRDWGEVRIWDPTTLLPLSDRGNHWLQISSDGRRAVTLASDLVVRLWDLDGGVEIARRRTLKGGSISLSGGGDRLLVSDGDQWNDLIDVATGVRQWSISGRAATGYPKLSRDGQLAATTTYTEGLGVHDVATGKQLWRLTHRDYQDDVAAFTPDSRLIVNQDADEILTVRNARDGRPVRRIGRPSKRWSIAISPDGKYLVERSTGFVIYRFDTGREIRRFPYGRYTFALADGVIALARGEHTPIIELARLEDGAALGKIALGPRFGVVTGLAMSADGARLLVGTDRGVILVLATRVP